MAIGKNKILVICGPTATGKTELAIKLAKSAFGGNAELISADSRQVYRGMDIGTGKDLPLNSKLKTQNSKLQFKIKNLQIGYYLFNQIPVWLLDIVKPDYKFNVADYCCCTNLVIKDIWKRNRLPIIVGGTGFYIKAVIDGIDTVGIPPSEKVRQGMKAWSAKELFDYLADLDSVKAATLNKSDKNNPRRLVRAIEVALWKKENSALQKEKPPSFSVLFIGLKADYKTLYQRIDRRVTERIQMGVEQEIKRLLKKGYSWESSVLGVTTGYREWQPYFSSKFKVQSSKLKEGVIKKWQFAEHGYARRQMTWFKKALRQAQGENKRIYWFDIDQKDWQDKLEKLVKKWYNGNKNDAKN